MAKLVMLRHKVKTSTPVKGDSDMISRYRRRTENDEARRRLASPRAYAVSPSRASLLLGSLFARRSAENTAENSTTNLSLIPTDSERCFAFCTINYTDFAVFLFLGIYYKLRCKFTVLEEYKTITTAREIRMPHTKRALRSEATPASTLACTLRGFRAGSAALAAAAPERNEPPPVLALAFCPVTAMRPDARPVPPFRERPSVLAHL